MHFAESFLFLHAKFNETKTKNMSCKLPTLTNLFITCSILDVCYCQNIILLILMCMEQIKEKERLKVTAMFLAKKFQGKVPAPGLPQIYRVYHKESHLMLLQWFLSLAGTYLLSDPFAEPAKSNI